MYNNNKKNSNKAHKYELPCTNFIPVAKFGNNGQLDYVNKIAQGGIGYADKIKCLRIQVTKGQSNWIMVRLIQIETQWTKYNMVGMLRTRTPDKLLPTNRKVPDQQKKVKKCPRISLKFSHILAYKSLFLSSNISDSYKSLHFTPWVIVTKRRCWDILGQNGQFSSNKEENSTQARNVSISFNQFDKGHYLRRYLDNLLLHKKKSHTSFNPSLGT